ncbi:MAG: hypothetical protein KJN64_06740 [Ignavibacteria bacterium]|nr:hypothetical protein [Ignavibacteria bacterium]MBT8392644.1 hypothetical protein [Ignavibacteria bacterium]NNJ52047.1 hypothetical protein [Ignavibacteriaceae bacterium]NNL22098.1 hypothetical protein [Ignavibacteriaceae bacterium]
MKKLFLLLVLVGITFLSCSDNQESNFVSSNSKFDLSSPGHLYASKLINGETGDELILNQTFIDSSGREIVIYARLRVLENSFPGSTTISMIPNVEDLSIKLLPDMNFNRSVRLDLSFSGINLEEFGYTTTGTYDFAFFAVNGDVELIDSDISHANLSQNEIKVLNAKLNHFSRYGWIR